jgi:AcrR family transcriptional regulator
MSNLTYWPVPTIDRRAKRKQQVRQKILGASREILLSQGFAALTMRRIAEAIDYAPATIYLHFQSREQIAQELCLAGLKRLHEHLQTVTTKDPAARLAGFGRAYQEYAQSDPETYRLIFMADPQLTKAVFTHRDSGGTGGASRDLIVTALVELLADSGRQTAKPVELAELLWAGWHGLASLRLACSNALTSDEFRLAQVLTAAVTDKIRSGSGKRKRPEIYERVRVTNDR